MNDFQALYRLLDEINAVARAGGYLVALFMSATLPDIACSLASEDGRATHERYKAWCEENLQDGFGFLTPEDMYSIRCGLLHQGRLGGQRHQYNRAIFLLPGPMKIVNGAGGDAYCYDAVAFCEAMTRAVRTWAERNLDDEIISKNLEDLVRYRPGGFAPYIVGQAVIG